MIPTNRDRIIRDFYAPGRIPILPLDWDEDIAPMLKDESILHYDKMACLSATSARILDMLNAVYNCPVLPNEFPLSMARQIVFELALSDDYEISFLALVPLSEYLAKLPLKPDIKWGYSRIPVQDHKVELRIIFTTDPSHQKVEDERRE